jgi:hypothetical protein
MSGMNRGMWGRFAEVALACVAISASLIVVDRTIAWTEVGYRAARARPNEDRRLERDEFDVRVVTNALGFREPRLPSPKPPGVLRVVALGDSFTQGYGVEEDDAYPRRLETLLAAGNPAQRIEVMNLGVPGTSPHDYLGHLADPGLAYAPDLVLVGVMANDVQDVWIQHRMGVRFAAEVLRETQREVAEPRPLWRRAPALLLPALYPFAWTQVDGLRQAFGAHLGPARASARTPEPGEHPTAIVPAARWRDVVLAMGDRFGRRAETADALAHLPPERAAAIEPVATGEVSLESDAGGSGYLDLLALVEPRLFADAVLLPPRYDEAWHATEGYLAAIAHLARRHGSRVAIIYIPAIHQVTPAARPALAEHGFAWDDRTLEDTTFPDRLRAFGTANDVPVIDLLPVFRAARDRPLYYPGDGHWTPVGQALAADSLAPQVAALLAR